MEARTQEGRAGEQHVTVPGNTNVHSRGQWEAKGTAKVTRTPPLSTRTVRNYRTGTAEVWNLLPEGEKVT